MQIIQILLAFWIASGLICKEESTVNNPVCHYQLIENALPDTIFWTPNLKLHWVDFRGTVSENSPYSAFTNTVISLKYSFKLNGKQVIPQFKVDCMFNCLKSWARKDNPDLLTDELLMHEQLHFDIAELTARKLRNALKNQKYTLENYEFKIDAIRNRIILDGERMQERYDLETGHGSQKKEQSIWEQKIAKELKRSSTWR
jgi:hypothetical protein